MGSILNDTKKILGIGPDYTAFDPDIITHINAVFSTLNQLGIGPSNGFSIESAGTDWPSFQYEDPEQTALVVPNAWLHLIKSYMYLRVRSLFDPPTASFMIDAMDRQIREFEWRLSTFRESAIELPPRRIERESEVNW